MTVGILSIGLVSCNDDDHLHCHCDLADGSGDVEFDVDSKEECEDAEANPLYDHCHIH